MTQNSPGPIRPYNPGLFEGISNRIKLILRLMADGRVNPLLKLIPLASGIYLVFPDLMPGPIDDALLIWLSTYLFVELCPPEIVSEHEEEIDRTMTEKAGKNQPGQTPYSEEDIIEGEIVNDKKSGQGGG